MAGTGMRSKARERKTGTRTSELMPKPRLFTLDEYEQMIATGIVRDGERVELIDGEIVQMGAMGGPHYWCVLRFNDWFVPRLRRRAVVMLNAPVRLQPRSAPEPDVTLLRYREDYDEERLPSAEDVLLVIEVAESSLTYDRGTKLRLYAAANIREVWIVNLKDDTILAFRKPRGDRYEETTTVGRGESLSPEAFPELVLHVNEVLPRRASRSGESGTTLPQ